LSNNLAFNMNRVIPIKWQLGDSSGKVITGLDAIVSLQVAPVLSGGGLGTPFNPFPSNGIGLRNDGKTYTFNWHTKNVAVGTNQILLTLAHGTMQTKTLQIVTKGGYAALQIDGTVGTATTGGLLGGDLDLYVDNTNGDLTADELARIQDAVTAADAVTEPYGVAVQEVSDPTLADVRLTMDTTSAVGGYADGVLGCTTDAGQITLIQGWNFYAGSDAAQIGSAQYDFETVVTHELGHALGLGHSTDIPSVMYATLNTGTVNRSLTGADLNVPDSDTDSACGLHAVLASPQEGVALVSAGTSPALTVVGSGPVADLGAAEFLLSGPRVRAEDAHPGWTQVTGGTSVLSAAINTALHAVPAFASPPAGLFRTAVATVGNGRADDPQDPDENPWWPVDGVIPAAPAANPPQIEQAIDVLLGLVDAAQEQPVPAAGTPLAASVDSVFAADAWGKPAPVQPTIDGYQSETAASAAVDPGWAWVGLLGLLVNTAVQGRRDPRPRGRLPLAP
jgi:hypothetical protein